MILVLRAALLLLLAFGVCLAAAPKVPVQSAESIPLPRQSHYLSQGLQAGMGLGNVWRSGCQSRFSFQGGAEYSYKSWISGGGAARLFGGAVDEDNSLVYTRYFTHVRMHTQPRSNLDLYMGPVFSFDNTSINTIRENLSHADGDTIETETGRCADAYDVNGPGLGWDAGAGWLLHPMFGLTASTGAEANLDKSIRFSFSGGFAFNLYAISGRMQRSLRAAWIHADWINAVRMHSSGWESSFLVGVSGGF